jgi:hypothetical protein
LIKINALMAARVLLPPPYNPSAPNTFHSTQELVAAFFSIPLADAYRAMALPMPNNHPMPDPVS